jgi:hypothetical protein
LPLEPATDRESTALAVTAPAVSAFERMASDPNVSVDKLERLIAMQERINAFTARAEFDAAFSEMQAELPVIDEKGRIEVKGQLRSTYAKLEDIHDVVKPIMHKFGFAMRHRTEWPADKPGIIRIVGILTHKLGHREETSFEAPMDRSEYRTDIQSQGSTVSYGRRYTTMDALNISTRGMDRDGAGKVPDAPEGYQEWIDGLKKAAEKGMLALEAAWACSDVKLKNFTVNHHKLEWLALKQKAQAVKA